MSKRANPTVIGGFLVGAVALAVGTGAILQVIVSVGRLLVAESRLEEASRVARPALLGIGTGAGVMYATALLVQI